MNCMHTALTQSELRGEVRLWQKHCLGRPTDITLKLRVCGRPRRVGPMLTVLIGVVLQFGGYYGMWLAAMGRFDCSYVGMLLLAMAACNGQAWYETAGLVTSVRNFETERYVAAAPAPLPPSFRAVRGFRRCSMYVRRTCTLTWPAHAGTMIVYSPV